MGTRLGGDYLFSAAYAEHHFLDAPKEAAPLYAEALAAYPSEDPTRSAVLLEQAQYELSRGNHPRAKALLKPLVSWAAAIAPKDMSKADAGRWRLLREALAEQLPRLQADLAEREGRFADAAVSLEALLNSGEIYLSPPARAMAWERIARWHQREGNKDGVERAIEEALENTAEGSARANLTFWRLHARHGLIARDGGPALTRTWPGPAFERDLRMFLRSIQGVEGTGTSYLALASSAFRADRKEIALEIYLLALRAPDLVEAARGDANIWRGLLMGFAAALELDRFEQAEQILSIVERIADEPIQEVDAYRIAIREARAAKLEREEKRKREAASGAEPGARPTPPTRVPLGRIETSGDADRGLEETEEFGLRDEESHALADWLWPVSAALLALALAALILARRRRG